MNNNKLLLIITIFINVPSLAATLIYNCCPRARCRYTNNKYQKHINLTVKLQVRKSNRAEKISAIKPYC